MVARLGWIDTCSMIRVPAAAVQRLRGSSRGLSAPELVMAEPQLRIVADLAQRDPPRTS